MDISSNVIILCQMSWRGPISLVFQTPAESEVNWARYGHDRIWEYHQRGIFTTGILEPMQLGFEIYQMGHYFQIILFPDLLDWILYGPTTGTQRGGLSSTVSSAP